MKYLKFLALAPLLMLTTACLTTTTPEVAMHQNRFQNPEVSSKPLNFKVELSSGSRSVVILSDEQSELTERNQELGGGQADNEDDVEGFLLLGASVSTGHGFEVSAYTHGKIALKYQFAGEPSDKSYAGNISHAVAIGYQHYDDSESGNIHWESDISSFDIAYIVGQRMSETIMLYGGPFVQFADADGNAFISYEVENERFESEDFPFSRTGLMVGANVAIEQRFDNGLGWGVEGVLTNSDWGDDKVTTGAVHLKFDYQF